MSNLVLARILSAEGFGIYVSVYTWYDFLALVALFGFQQNVVKYLPYYREEKDFQKISGFLSFSNYFVWLTSVLIGLAAIFIIEYFLALKPILKTSFLIGLPILIFMSFSQLYQGKLRAIDKVFKADFPHLVFRYLVLLTGVGLVYFLNEISAKWAILFSGLGAMSSSLLGWYWFNPDIPAKKKRTTMPKLRAGYLIPLLYLS